MTERDFAYWLQGFFELSGSKDLLPEQVQIIKEHLALVFNKKTSDTPLYMNGTLLAFDTVDKNGDLFTSDSFKNWEHCMMNSEHPISC